ncbi:hypothetical protein F5B18DRAFT_433033 [Nemania serpens]|nr:hypothetical protein F5B18DRAFT_433033 [Nemania serpens]
MKLSPVPSFSLFAISTHAAFLSASNSTTTNTTNTTITTTTATATATTTPSPTPAPPTYLVQCGASMDGLCSSICFCGSGGRRDLNCHADPSAQCRNMCRCVPESRERAGGGEPWV